MFNTFITQIAKRYVLAIILLLTAGLYVVSIQGGFIWDDVSYIINNHLITAPGGLSKIWFSKESPDYWPFSYTVIWLEWRLWEHTPFAFHIVNIVLHLICTTLVYKILLRLNLKWAWLAALIFAIHPVNVETVSWIFQIKTLLACLFGFLATLYFIKSQETKQRTNYLVALCSFVIGLLSKSTIVTLPAFLLILDCIALPSKFRVIRRILPFLTISAIIGGISLWFNLNNSMGGQHLNDATLLEKVTNAGQAYWFYIFKALAPVTTVFVYPKPFANANIPMLVFLAFTAIAIPVFLLVRPHKLFTPTIAYFSITILPVLGFIDIYFMKFSPVADHWQYFSIIGIIVLVSEGFRLLYQQADRRLAIVVILIYLTALLTLNIHSQSRFADEKTMWLRTIKQNPNAWFCYNNLGNIYYNAKNKDSAGFYYKKAVELAPHIAEVNYNLGTLLFQQQQYNVALPFLKAALDLEPGNITNAYWYGRSLIETNASESAVPLLRKTLTEDPENAAAEFYLGRALIAVGQYNEGYRYIVVAARHDSSFALFPHYYSLAGSALLALKKHSDAIRIYKQGLKLFPNVAMFENNLGVAYAALDSFEQATQHYQNAIQQDSTLAEPHASLAMVLAAQGNKTGAIVECKIAMKKNKAFPAAMALLKTLQK